MEGSNLVEAREAIKQLFEFIGIEQIFCIDDEYSHAPSYEEIIGFCVELGSEKSSAVPYFASISFDEQEEIWREQIKRLWNKSSEEDKNYLYRQLYTIVYEDRNDDTRAASSLEELLRGYSLLEITPRQWVSEKSKLLNSENAHKTLLLFDREFLNDPGIATDGINLIEDALATYGEKVICGLLSHTADSDKAYDEWCQIAKDRSLDKSKFIFIPKDCLYKDLLDFAWMIKLAVLNEPCKILQEKASAVINKAQVEAQKKVEFIHIYDFEHIVFEASLREGIWEPDTLFRLYGLFHRVEARKKARNDTELHNIAALVRNVSSIPTSLPQSPKHSSWKIQRLELYEEPSYLNSLHMPIELGDIFERTSGDKYKKFIVLAQPCDLMVRSNGKRHEAISEVILAEIVDITDEATKSQSQETHFELPYYSSDGKSQYVSFRKRHTVKLCVLDLCVYQDDGSSIIKLSDSCSDNIIPAWKHHYDELQKIANKQINRYTQLQRENARREILALAIPQSSNDNLFKGKIDPTERSISYECRRVGRLCQPQALAMLTKFANYLARAAFEVDFGK